MTPKEVETIARKVVAEACAGIEYRIKDFPAMERIADAMRSECSCQISRLSAPQPDKFEGVKYVVTDCAEYRRVSTREAWVKEYGEQYAPNDGLYVQPPEGGVVWGRLCDYTPWHPEVGEKVRLEERPQEWGTLVDIWKGGTQPAYYAPYRVRWHLKGGDGDGHPLSELRPFSFAPPEPEPKPEFPNGTLVVDAEGCVAVVTLTGKYHTLGTGQELTGRFHKAADADLAAFIWGSRIDDFDRHITIRALRAYYGEAGA